VRYIIDFIRKVNVGIENSESIVVVVDNLEVLEDVMTEVGLDGGLEGVGPVVEKSCSFNLKIKGFE
jgi:hypothetical protein